MPRTIHVALVRAYRSLSSYGEQPFTVPSGYPMTVALADETLEVHLGDVPNWLRQAQGRLRILAPALQARDFLGEPFQPAMIDAKLSSAEPAVFTSAAHQWLVALILKTTVEWEDHEVQDRQCLWPVSVTRGRIHETATAMKKRSASLDLASRTLLGFLPDAIEDRFITDQVFVARTDEFDDAISPLAYSGAAGISVTRPATAIDTIASTRELTNALANALVAPAVPHDPNRTARMRAALGSDLLPDADGSYGRYELYRELQRELMRASQEKPLAVLYMDLNDLKSFNSGAREHAGGDDAIASFREIIDEQHRNGMLFRVGGDEFVVFSRGRIADTTDLGRRILRGIATRTVDGRALSAAAGLVLASDPCEEPKAIIERADKQARHAKDASHLKDGKRACVLWVAHGDPETVAIVNGREP